MAELKIMDICKAVEDEIKKACAEMGMVAVVRCKDCKFYYRMTAETGICQLGCPHLGNDGFCSEGERKDGEHDRG